MMIKMVKNEEVCLKIIITGRIEQSLIYSYRRKRGKSLLTKGKEIFMREALDQFKEVHMVICDRLMDHEDPWRVGVYSNVGAHYIQILSSVIFYKIHLRLVMPTTCSLL